MCHEIHLNEQILIFIYLSQNDLCFSMLVFPSCPTWPGYWQILHCDSIMGDSSMGSTGCAIAGGKLFTRHKLWERGRLMSWITWKAGFLMAAPVPQPSRRNMGRGLGSYSITPSSISIWVDSEVMKIGHWWATTLEKTKCLWDNEVVQHVDIMGWIQSRPI